VADSFLTRGFQEPHASQEAEDAVRVMFYSHDTYGLGHLRRTLALAGYFRDCWAGMSQLIVTGSPVPSGYRLPKGADYVKLPSVVKVGAGRYASRSLATPFEDVLAVRRDLLLGVARSFQPDALVVDHAPAGLKGEMVDTLGFLTHNSPETGLILGLRDIVDEAPRVRRDWKREGVYDLLDSVYDRILVYGKREIYDPVTEYRFSARAARKSRYVGYLRRKAERPADAVRRELALSTGRLVLVTAGGGGDGHQLFEVMLEGIRRSPGPVPFDCVLVCGPLMPDYVRRKFERMASGLPGVRFLDFVADLAAYIGAADVVVAMAGHNSVSEILSFGRPSILVPRVSPRREQVIRAEALRRRGLVRMIQPAELTPERLLADVEELLDHPDAVQPPFELDGLPGAATELEELMHERAGSSYSSSSQPRSRTRPAGRGES
jgi:predicted glycosyltransferase